MEKPPKTRHDAITVRRLHFNVLMTYAKKGFECLSKLPLVSQRRFSRCLADVVSAIFLDYPHCRSLVVLSILAVLVLVLSLPCHRCISLLVSQSLQLSLSLSLTLCRYRHVHSLTTLDVAVLGKEFASPVPKAARSQPLAP